MCSFDTTLRALNADWHVEDGLLSARIPQPRGGEVRVVVEAMPDEGWDWVVWRVGGGRLGVWHGVCALRPDAMLAAEKTARLLRLAPNAMMRDADTLAASA
ncbi:hypothetical protein [Acidisphaera rubrifaciens]|uniref:Uncharacterized protein n=1 Tax=Acidisphaera rubrifaciens HS-AP3 TaxID=1231350 RepID=A0A0D6P8B9_9PROT|nr:hypothetical protein [Acidisphaera rubrifaciens]GAN77591.1 hypothetical protein Asru_0386_07 [Acidisphaera rubrifaciens HS-AP3]